MGQKNSSSKCSNNDKCGSRYRESRSNLPRQNFRFNNYVLKKQEIYDRLVALTSDLTQDQIEKINLKSFTTSSLTDMLSFYGDTYSVHMLKSVLDKPVEVSVYVNKNIEMDELFINESLWIESEEKILSIRFYQDALTNGRSVDVTMDEKYGELSRIIAIDKMISETYTAIFNAALEIHDDPEKIECSDFIETFEAHLG